MFNLFHKKPTKTNLAELLGDNILLTEQGYSTVEALLTQAFILLEKQEIVEHRYIDAVLKNYQDSGDYMIYTDAQTAMPHARPEEGAIETGVSLVVLKKPFMHLGHPISYVFGISAKDNKNHGHLIAAISAFMNNTHLVNTLRTSPNEKFIKRLLRGIEVEETTSTKEKPNRQKFIKVITICGNGLGSSLMLAGKIEVLVTELQQEHNLSTIVSVEAKDFSNAKQTDANLYVSVEEFIKQLDDAKNTIAVKAYHVLTPNEQEAIKSHLLTLLKGA